MRQEQSVTVDNRRFHNPTFIMIFTFGKKRVAVHVVLGYERHTDYSTQRMNPCHTGVQKKNTMMYIYIYIYINVSSCFVVSNYE